MKKLLRYLMGLGGKAPTPPPMKRTVPAHEFALKQANARRRSEKAKEDEAAGEVAATSEAPVVVEQAAAAGDGAIGHGAQKAQSSPPGTRRKARKAPHQPEGSEVERRKSRVKRQRAEVGVDGGSARDNREVMLQPTGVVVSPGVVRVKRKMKHRHAEAGIDADVGRKKRRRKQK